MKLSAEEERMLDGKLGSSMQKAMELLVGVGEAYDAERMIKIASAHILPPDLEFFPIGELAGWARDLVAESVESAEGFKVPTTIAPIFCAPGLLKRLSYPESYVDELGKSIAHGMNLYKRLGVIPIYTCIPSLLYPPRKGEHLGQAGSEVVLFANSVCGAMTNRESGPTALAAAITGRTPFFGMHLPENRLGQALVELKDDLNPENFTYTHYGVMGLYVGKQAGNKIPVFVGLSRNISVTTLKHLGTPLAVSGGIPMYHVIGVTPEALTIEAAFGSKKPATRIEVGRQEIKATFDSLCSATDEKVDLVILGCPHLAIEEISRVAKLLEGKRIRDGVTLILGTSELHRSLAQMMGLVDIIEAAGGLVLSGICTSSFPRRAVPPGFRLGIVATDSAKAAHYMGVAGVQVWLGSIEKCVRAAIKGRWEVD